MRAIGILALQGGVEPHARALEAIGHRAVEIRSASDVGGIEGLILPGGESTTQLRLLERDPALSRALIERIESGLPLLATCAGLVLAARSVRSPSQACFGWIDVTVCRNGYGRQRESRVLEADDGRTELVLIRAPRIEEVGPSVEVLVLAGGEPVLVRQGARYGATFHPELTNDASLHARVFA